MNLKDSYLHGTDLIALIRALKWDGGVLKYLSASTSTDWISVGAIPIWNQNTTGKAATAGTADKVKNSLTFTGGVTGTWDGSSAKTITIPTKSSWNYDDVYLKLAGGILTGDLRIKFRDTDKFIMWDYDGDNTAGASWRIGAKGTGSGNANYFCIESGTNGPSASTWHNVLNIGQNDFTVYFSQTPKVGSTNVSLEGHTHNYLPLSGGTMSGTISLPNGTYISNGSTISGYGMLFWDGTNTNVGSTHGNTIIRNSTGDLKHKIGSNEYNILDSNNSSVSLNNSTLSVKINGITQSLTNTWRGILDNLTSTSAIDSLSAKQGKLLNDKFANYLSLTGGTVTGATTFSLAINANILGNATTSDRVNNSLKIQLKGGTTEGTNQFTFDGSSAKTINITLASIGAQPAGSYKTIQTAVDTIGSSSNTLTFINSISLNTNGVITATTGVVRNASISASGVVSTEAQSFAGAKTFTANIKASAAAGTSNILEGNDLGSSLIVKRTDGANWSIITFLNTAGTLGYLGFNANKQPIYRTSSGIDYVLYHSGNNPNTDSKVRLTATDGTATDRYIPFPTTGTSLSSGSTYELFYQTDFKYNPGTKLFSVPNITLSNKLTASLAEIDSLTLGNLVVQGTSSLGTVTAGTWNGSRLTSSYIPTDVVYTGATLTLTNKTISTGSTYQGNAIADAYISSAATWNGKWAWNANDIKGVKVDNAAAADNATNASKLGSIDAKDYMVRKTPTPTESLKQALDTNLGKAVVISLSIGNTNYTGHNNVGIDNRSVIVHFQGRVTSHWNLLYLNSGQLKLRSEDHKDWYNVYHSGNLSPMTTSHAANSITSTKISNWDAVYNWYSATTDPSTDAKIDKWFEIENFLNGVTNALTLTGMLMLYVTLNTAQTITGAKTFSQVINGDILGNSTTTDRFKNSKIISLTGNVIGSATWDASGNLSISTTVNGGNADTATTASVANSVAWTNVTGKPSSFTPSSHEHTYIKAKNIYTFTANTLPNSFDLGISAGFVINDSGFGSYGSVLTVRTYEGGGGSLQLYAPYSNTYGGSRLKARFGDYASASGNSWTALKEIAWLEDIPTNNNQLTNGAGYITGITKKMVTDALGYTPPTTNTTYNFSGTSFTSGNSSTGEHNANNITSNGHWYYTSNGPSTSIGASTNDGALYSQAYSNFWVAQIAQDYRNGRLFVRGKNNGTWLDWKRIAITGESQPANGGNADTVDGEHASAFAHIGAHNNLIASGNEFTFVPSGFSGTVWFNYRTAGGDNGNITEYKFGNGKGGELGTAIHSGNYNSYAPKKDGTGASGTWGINISGNADTIDGKHANYFVQRINGTGSIVHYIKSFLNWNGILITIPLTWSPQLAGMFVFTIRLYHDHKYTDIVISGYNYGTNHWHLPKAEIIGGIDANYKVKFGWFDTDTNKKLWVWIGRSNNKVFGVGGFTIMNVYCGWVSYNMYEGWESANVSESELTNVQHSIDTLYLPVKSNGSITGNAATATNVAWSGVTNKPNLVNSFGSKTGDITVRGGQTGNGSVNLVMSNNELLASIVGLGSNAYTSTAYLPLAGGTMTGLLTTTYGNNHNGIKVGNTYINAIDGELIFQNNSAIRFGGDSWNYNVWAGLKYVYSSKIIYLGLADGSAFTANSAQSGGKLYLPGIANIYTGNGTNLVWHAGNDGSGSGLDADLLDGKHASAFATSDHNHDSTYVAIAGNQIIAGNKTFSGTTSLSIAEIDSLTTGNLVNQGSASLGTITSGIWNASTIAADYLPLGGTDSGTKRWVKKDATTGLLYIDLRNDIQTLPTGNKAYLTYIGALSSSNNNKSNAATTNGNTYMKIFEDNILKNQYKISGSGSVSVASDANGNITITGTTYTNNVSTPDEAISFAAANYNLSSASWTSATSLTSYSGTFAIQIKDTNSTTNKTNYYSGIIMLNGSTGRLAVEEIPLSALMATGSDTEVPTRIYAGIQQGVLKLSSQDASAVAHNITVKILKLIAL